MILKLTLAGLMWVCAVHQCIANDETPHEQRIYTQAVTKGTLESGKRRSADSDWTILHAPENCVYAENEVVIDWVSKAGSEHDVHVEFADYVPVDQLGNIKMPRTIKVRSHARSPKHKHGARGWAKANVVVPLVPYRS